MAPSRISATVANKDHEYVEDLSRGKMFRWEDSLPELPVPTLEQTADRYLTSVQPLLNKQDFAHTQGLVKDFIKPDGAGARAQAHLLERAKTHQNWLAEWWNLNAYMAYRDPVVFNVSYFYAHRDSRMLRDPVRKAAYLSAAILRFKHMVDSGELEPEYMRKQPLEVSSYAWMFNATRLPVAGADVSEKFDPSAHQNILVMRKGKIFIVPHAHPDGRTLTVPELEDQFRRVVEMAGSQNGPGVGALTSQQRDDWTEARKWLAYENADLLEQIDGASFVVCLDDTTPVTLEERARTYWHGDGINRWYDKPLNFIVGENGASGFLGEHSMMDGTPTHRLNDWVCGEIAKGHIGGDETASVEDYGAPHELKFRLDLKLEKAIEYAQKEFGELVRAHDVRVQAYQRYGKGLIKQFKCSPDAYVQLMIQLAYHKMYGTNRPTYESAATRAFKQGRTETCRVLTEQVKEFCDAMAEPQRDMARCVRLARAAIAQHVTNISQASVGFGVDRHLLGLKLAAAEAGEKPHPVFTDPVFAYSSHWFLSTSQLSSEYYVGYGWGQVVPDGYGVAYMINEDWLNFNIACRNDTPTGKPGTFPLDADAFWFWLREAGDDLREIFSHDLAKPKL